MSKFFISLPLPFSFQISKVTEMNLSANQERSTMEKKRLAWKVEGSAEEETKVVRGGPVDPATLVVELAPMEIRTFFIDFDRIKMFGSWRGSTCSEAGELHFRILRCLQRLFSFVVCNLLILLYWNVGHYPQERKDGKSEKEKEINR